MSTLNKFDLITAGGVEKLIQKDHSPPIKYYCSASKLHDILEKVHAETGRKASPAVKKTIKE